MTVKLVMLKSGEDIITDLKEIKSDEEVIGYYFNDPFILKSYQQEKPTLLTEDGTNKGYRSRFNVKFYPWIPLSLDRQVPCSADWVVTIVNPVEQLKKQYEDNLNGQTNKDSTVNE